MADTPASILLIDDHPLLRKGIKQLIEMEPDLEVAGEASNATDGVRIALELEPDLILMDLNMPDVSGVEALRAGADGYLLKDMEPEDMIKQLHQAAVGKLVISERLTSLLADALRSNKSQQPARPDFDSLTPREKDIPKLIAEGLSNKMIGRKLDISDGTVKVHVKHLLKKLNLRSRVEVAVWAAGEGLHKI
jgi:two-component system nitrate/nitrite response regulator NarL